MAGAGSRKRTSQACRPCGKRKTRVGRPPCQCGYIVLVPLYLIKLADNGWCSAMELPPVAGNARPAAETALMVFPRGTRCEFRLAPTAIPRRHLPVRDWTDPESDKNAILITSHWPTHTHLCESPRLSLIRTCDSRRPRCSLSKATTMTTEPHHGFNLTSMTLRMRHLGHSGRQTCCPPKAPVQYSLAMVLLWAAMFRTVCSMRTSPSSTLFGPSSTSHCTMLRAPSPYRPCSPSRSYTPSIRLRLA